MEQDDIHQFELAWIVSLEQNPDEASRAEDWLEAQAWTDDFGSSNV